MAEPTFFSEGNAPRQTDALWKIEQKILGAIRDGGGGGGGGGAPNLSGIGSPVGVVTPTAVNQWYTDTAGNFIWQSTGLTNVDWAQRT